MNTVIKADHLYKTYKLYENPKDRLVEAVIPFTKKRHTEFNALGDVSFSVKKGESVGIIGKNGSGKSTLLKILTGVITESAGTLKTKGRIAALIELGAGFNPEYTGMENTEIINKTPYLKAHCLKKGTRWKSFWQDWASLQGNCNEIKC